ncbi:MAG: DUF202 domain-containing protein [Shimia sp.]
MADTNDKTDMAEERTDWAEDRTILAVERTFASWMGLGLGFVGVGLALNAVFGPAEPTWLAKGSATAFLLIAIAAYFIARHQACESYHKLEERYAQATRPRTFTFMATAAAIATIIVGAVLWTV